MIKIKKENPPRRQLREEKVLDSVAGAFLQSSQ
jgi:hypothetical protein